MTEPLITQRPREKPLPRRCKWPIAIIWCTIWLTLLNCFWLAVVPRSAELARSACQKMSRFRKRLLSLCPHLHTSGGNSQPRELNARITLIGRSGRIAIDSSPLYTRHLADADRDRPPCGHLHVSGSHLAAPQAGAPVHRREGAHQSIFDPYASYVLDRGPAGVHDGKQLYEEIRTLGFVFQSSPGAQLLAAPA